MLPFFIILCVFATSILSGILGMAGGMVLMGALVWVLPVRQAMILHATSQFFANGSRAFIHRKHIHRKSLRFYFAGLAVTLLVFIAVSYAPDKLTVFLLMGASPFLAFALPKNLKLDFTKPLQAFFCGITVTVFQLTGGVSGPMLDIFFQTRNLTRHETVATKAFTQAVSHLTKFFYFGFIITAGEGAGLPLWLYFAVIPAAIAGSHLSKSILEKLTDKQFYSATQTVLLVVGAVYLQKAFTLWVN